MDGAFPEQKVMKMAHFDNPTHDGMSVQEDQADTSTYPGGGETRYMMEMIDVQGYLEDLRSLGEPMILDELSRFGHRHH